MILTTVVGIASMATLGAPSAMDGMAAKLKAAEGLEVVYNLNVVGGSPQTVRLVLSKPNKALIETPSETIVADGEMITRAMKGDKVYYKTPQTDAKLKALFKGNHSDLWLGFFDDNAYSRFASARVTGSKKRGKMDFNVVEATVGPRGEGKYTLYVDKSDSLTKQAEIVTNEGGRTYTTIMSTRKVVLGAQKADLFAFTAPAGFEEIQEVDLVAGKWVYDLDEAKKAAMVGEKLIMVDFAAEWCGPCKMMEKEVFSTSAFKEATKGMVLAKIDVDHQKSVAQAYGITAMPTVKFLNPQGQVVHEFTGYGGPAQVLGEIKKARQKYGK